VPPDQTDRLNTALAGRYRIVRHLGEGGMAAVYLCEDVKHKRRVALKLLKPELAAVLGADRFVQEITTTAGLQHPHILPLFDSGTADGFLFYVMPYIEGETLREKLNRETQLGVDEAVRIAREVADALDYAHRHGVIHRDIKPENILMHDGRPMVADFGMSPAVPAAAGGRMTETGLSLGTPHYMSPEQATAEKEITARSDIYSIGSVLYEMLTGSPPHTGATAQQIIMKIITEPAEPVTKLRKSVPPNVAAAVAKSIEKLPADRFETAKTFADALVNPSFTTSTVARPAGASVATSARVSFPVMLATTVGAAALAVAVTWWVMSRNIPSLPEIQLSFQTSPAQPLRDFAGRDVLVSPDGRTVVYSTADSLGRSHLYVRTLNNLRQEIIPGSDGAQYPFFSPDGRSIGFLAGRTLKKLPLAGGTATPLTEVGSMRGSAWGPMGILISVNNRLHLVPPDGGKPVRVAHPDSVAAYWPVLLPGGKSAIHSVSFQVDAPFAVTDLSSGQTAFTTVSGIAPIALIDGQLFYARADAAMMAVTFDPKSLRATGSPRVVIPEILRNSGIGESKVAVSASGTLVYVKGSGLEQLVSVDLQGRTRPLPVPPGKFADLRLSPDGRRFATTEVKEAGRWDVYVYDAASGAAQRITAEGSSNFRPEWSPDGKRLLYRTNRQGRYDAIWWQSIDGTGAAEPLLEMQGKGIWQAMLSPDSKWVVFRTGTQGDADIFYRAVSGDTTIKPFAATPFTEYAPRFSPDGRWVSYQSDESGSMQVYVRPFPGPGAPIPVSVNGGTNAVWGRDGRRLFFTNGVQMVSANVVLSPSFSVTSREVIFEVFFQAGSGHPSYDSSPDGKSLLMGRPVVGVAEQIVVIPNWVAQLAAGAKVSSPQ